jgi:hypothetical protein
MVEEQIQIHQSSQLRETDLELLQAGHGCIFYRKPVANWKALIGECADSENTLEVGLGLGGPDVDPDSPVRVVALALASRRPDNPFIKLVWYPDVTYLTMSE